MDIESFLQYLLVEKRYTPHTIRAYKDDLHQFASFINDVYSETSVSQVSTTHIRSFLAHLVDHNFSKRSVNRKLSSIKSYFSYLQKQELITINPAVAIPSLKSDQQLPVFLEVNPLTQLLADLPKGNLNEFRDYLLLYLLYTLGLRRSELIALRIDDFDFTQMRVKIMGKGKKERWIPISNHLRETLQEYQDVKAAAGISHHPLLLTNKGKKMYPNFVYRKIKELLSKATTNQKKSPHTLRHSFATHLLNQGADIMSIKELLGHESLQATQVYTHTNIEELKKIYKKSHPSFKLK